MHAEFAMLYKYVDGAHMFATREPRLKGLLVMHADPQVAFDEVTKQINFLLQRDGEKMECKPALPYGDFKAWLTKVLEKEDVPIQTIPAARIRFECDGLVAA